MENYVVTKFAKIPKYEIVWVNKAQLVVAKFFLAYLQLLLQLVSKFLSSAKFGQLYFDCETYACGEFWLLYVITEYIAGPVGITVSWL